MPFGLEHQHLEPGLIERWVRYGLVGRATHRKVDGLAEALGLRQAFRIVLYELHPHGRVPPPGTPATFQATGDPRFPVPEKRIVHAVELRPRVADVRGTEVDVEVERSLAAIGSIHHLERRTQHPDIPAKLGDRGAVPIGLESCECDARPGGSVVCVPRQLRTRLPHDIHGLEVLAAADRAPVYESVERTLRVACGRALKLHFVGKKLR